MKKHVLVLYQQSNRVNVESKAKRSFKNKQCSWNILHLQTTWMNTATANGLCIPHLMLKHKLLAWYFVGLPEKQWSSSYYRHDCCVNGEVSMSTLLAIYYCVNHKTFYKEVLDQPQSSGYLNIGLESNSMTGNWFIQRTSLRTVPTIVIAHTFCASPDTRISYRQWLLIQGYFCAVWNYPEKVDLSKYSWYPKRKLGVTMHFWEIIKLQFEKKRHTLLCMLKLFTDIIHELSLKNAWLLPIFFLDFNSTF